LTRGDRGITATQREGQAGLLCEFGADIVCAAIVLESFWPAPREVKSSGELVRVSEVAGRARCAPSFRSFGCGGGSSLFPVTPAAC